MSSKIINFLRGGEFDCKMRHIMELQHMPDWKIERTHDVIQWLFPTDIPSEHNSDAPVLTPEDIEIIKNDSIIKAAIQKSLERMIYFYERNDYWITQRNHNYLRITRILRCLWLAGLTHDYVSLQKCLDDIFVDYPDIIGEETYLYWKNANNDIFIKCPPKIKEETETLDGDPSWFEYT